MRRKLLAGAAIATAGVMLFASPAGAQDVDELVEEFQATEGLSILLDNLWIFVAGVLVFFMQAGFGLLEAGLTRAKNVANIMMKNLTDMSVGVLAFLLVGFSIGFQGDSMLGGLFGFDGLGVKGIDQGFGWFGQPLLDAAQTGEDFDPAYGTLFPSTFFFFQAAFAATAATIVAGAMAERTKFRSYAIFSAGLTAFIYPVILRWTWGGGWLADREYPFSDFAGSTVVHSTGGWAALMGAIIVGPRIGKFTKDGKPRAIPGHSMAMVVLGAFILFIGWFGFNPGSELAMDEWVGQLGVKTLMAAAAGAVVATAVVWIKDGKPEVSMAANGLLAGLVSITAPVGTVETWVSVVIGAVGGLIVVLSVKMFDRLRVDDPVGAISVHGVCGAWGTLSIGLFAWQDDAFLAVDEEGDLVSQGLFYSGELNQMLTQVTYVVAHFVFVAVAAAAFFLAIKAVFGLRVSEEEELAGLDVEEHGSPGYGPDLLNGGGAATAIPAESKSEPAMSGGS